MKKYVLASLLSFLFISAHAQDEIFGPVVNVKSRKGFILTGNGSVDLPAGDMAKRFGLSYRLGPAVMYKTESNWIFGAKFDFITGNKIKEDSLMINIRDKYNSNFNGKVLEFIDISGNRVGVPIYERGYMVGLQAGKIISFSKSHPDDGLMLLTSVGFMQHKINIYDKDKSVSQILGPYLKGYDRLTNGAFVEEFVGYTYFAKNGLLNFNLGVDVAVGFTQDRRDYLFDVMRTDNNARKDILIGLRGGWMIPIFRKKVEDISFE